MGENKEKKNAKKFLNIHKKRKIQESKMIFIKVRKNNFSFFEEAIKTTS